MWSYSIYKKKGHFAPTSAKCHFPQVLPLAIILSLCTETKSTKELYESIA